MNEMPQMLTSTYASSAVDPALWVGAGALAGARPKQGHWDMERLMHQLEQPKRQAQPAPQPKQEKKMGARIVKVFMADTDENIPLDKRVLYTGDEKLTDSTDQELFFEIPVQELLTKHNDYRLTLTDKKASAKAGKDVQLEPLRIRDLKMVVVTVAEF